MANIDTQSAETTSLMTDMALPASLNGISLSQALRDFDVANARVLGLTKRLTAMSRELLDLRSERTRFHFQQAELAAKCKALESAERRARTDVKDQINQLSGRLEQIRASRAVTIASLFSGKLRSVLK